MPDTLSRPFPQSTATLIDRGNSMIYEPNQNITRQQKVYCLEAGANEILVKPLGATELKEKLEECSGKRSTNPMGFTAPLIH